MKIRLVPVDKDNWEECYCLSVSDEQDNFVADNSYSILQSLYGENLYPMCIYNDDNMVGFLMYDIDPETNRWELSRLMIDKEYQGSGYGRQALIVLLEKLKNELGQINFYTSVEPENKVMKKLIESLDFSATGEIMGEEEVYCKPL